MKKKQPLLDLDNARYQDQADYMRQILNDGLCPFCWEHLKQYHKRPIEWEGSHFVVTKNHWPYVHTKTHLLVIIKRHITRIEELTSEEWAELKQAFDWAMQNYDFPGGALAMRFGDTNYSAGSVVHLHAQIILPDIDDPDYDSKPVRFKIGKTKK